MKRLLVILSALLLASCASMISTNEKKFAGSAVDYLYPSAKEPVQMVAEQTVQLKLPVRVGIAFAPSNPGRISGPTEDERLLMLEKVKEAFSKYEFIGAIEIIPSAYLQPKGGFSNLEQAARMFNVDVVALLSYDQMQFNDVNKLSMLYWTIIGAYLVHGDQYDIHTMLDASVFDVSSHKLLFRAPGVSNVKGSAAMATFNEKSRAARNEGFNTALSSLIPNLQKELERFRERVKTDKSIQVQHRAGYSGGGDFGWLGIVFAVILLGVCREKLA